MPFVLIEMLYKILIHGGDQNKARIDITLFIYDISEYHFVSWFQITQHWNWVRL